MKVLVTGVVEEVDQLRVTFECTCGQGTVPWTGATPTAGEYRHVEFEIKSILVVGKNMLETNEPSGLRTIDGAYVLVGEVTAAETDGYVRIELGCGGIDAEVSGELPAVRRRYRIHVDDLRAFDCNY